jgi:hypothetical protein
MRLGRVTPRMVRGVNRSGWDGVGCASMGWHLGWEDGGGLPIPRAVLPRTGDNGGAEQPA